jgi:hypothetical protein
MLLLFSFVIALALVQSGWIRQRKGIAACGLAGFSGKTPVDVMALRILLLDNEVRGYHSVGVYGKQLFKDVGSPKDNIVKDDFVNAVSGANEVIMHNRWATMATVTKEAAHPFKVGSGKNVVYGAHNGWIPQQIYQRTCKELGLEKAPDVDSEAIYQILHKHNMDFDILSRIDAMMALSFIYDGHLYLYRRASRPLWLGETKPGELYYSSREEGLEFIGCKYYHPLPTERMYVIKNGLIVDSFPVRQSRLHYLSENTTQQAWEFQIHTRHRKFYPEVWKPEKKSTTTNTSRGDSDRQTGFQFGQADGYRTNRETSSTKGKKSSEQEEKELIFEYLEADILEHSSEVKFEKGKVKFMNVYDVGDTDSTHFVLNLRDSINEAPLANWTIGFEGLYAGWTLTTHRGYATLRISDDSFGHDDEKIFRLIAVDPFNYGKYYTKEIKVKKGRVVEGALLVPFRTKEEAQKSHDFRSMPDNLITRALLSIRTRQRVGNAGLNKSVESPKADKQQSDEGSEGGSDRTGQESQHDAIRGAAAALLLLQTNSGQRVGRPAETHDEGVAEARPRAGNYKDGEAQSTEILGPAGPQSFTLLVPQKDTDFRNPAAAKFFGDMSEQLAKDQKAKQDRLDNVPPAVRKFLTDVRETMSQNAKVKVLKMKKFVFLDYEREEYLVCDLRDKYADYEEKISQAVNMLQDVVSEIDADPTETRRVVAEVMGDLILLGHDFSNELGRYKSMTQQEDFQPF